MNFYTATFVLYATVLSGCVSANSPESIDRGDFGPFKRSLNTRSHGYQLVDDPVAKFPLQQVERFEVRPGDCANSSGWSDCKTDRERSEIKETLSRRNIDSTSWYGWNFYVPPDWPTVYPTKTVLGQFHQSQSHPVWMFLQQNAGLYLDDQSLGRSTRKILLIPADDFKDQWHRIKVHARWATDETGFIKVWVNNKLLFEHQGKTMTADAVYFKYGVYRSFLTRFKSTFDSNVVPTQIAYFTNVRKSATQSGLLE